VHVAWTVGGAVYLASTKLGGTSTVDKLFDSGQDVSQAGPVGKPGITLDGNGDPWVAFTAETSGGREVHVIHPSGSKIVDDVAATLANCNSCGSPQPTGIGVVGGQPLVVYVDAAAGAIGAATFSGGVWKTATASPSDAQSPPRGLSFATDGKAAYASFYGGDAVEVASLSDGSWKTTKVSAATTPAGSSSGNLAPSTAVAVDEKGTVYVAWLDQDGLRLSSGTDTFTPVEIGHTTASAASPSLASSGSGVALSWYDTDQQNLMAGFLGDLQGLLVAQPSPSLTLSQAPSPQGTTCGKDGAPVLDITAQGIAFDPTCLVAVAGKPFEINFDNEDAGTQHNVAIYTDNSFTKALFNGDVITGVAQTTYKVDALDAGQYAFKCDIHANMTGQFVVVK
jgi:plastocyanin